MPGSPDDESGDEPRAETTRAYRSLTAPRFAHRRTQGSKPCLAEERGRTADVERSR